MSTHRLGRKFTCYSCHTKFYDLSKPEPICPKCGSDQRDAEEKPVATSRGRRAVEPPPPPPVEADLTEAEDEELGPVGEPEVVGEEEDLVSPAGAEEEAEDEDDDDEEEGDF